MANYTGLVNKNNTIYNIKTGTPYPDPTALAKDLGIDAKTIDWSKIQANPNWQMPVAQPPQPVVPTIDNSQQIKDIYQSKQVRDIYQSNFGRQPTQIELNDQNKAISEGRLTLPALTNWATTNPQNIKATGQVSQPQAFQGAPLPTTAGEVKAGDTAPPTPPVPVAGNITDQYTQSVLAQVEATRKTLETAYQKQIDDLKTQQTASQAKIDAFNQQYKDTLAEAKPLTEPFRQTLETTERQRLDVEKNYQENQKLVDELGTLLTDINTQIEAEKATTGLASIREPRIAQAKETAIARTGVIQAVMAARNGQITVAENLIDRTANAIAADRTDKLNYYNTLLKFYDAQKGEEGTKLLALTTEQKTWAKAQIGLLEGDLATSQANADFLKKAMADPDTAMAYAQAGVTLNDNLSQINTKLANYGYQKEVSATSKNMAEKGYSYLASGQTAPADAEIATITDSKGNQKQWYKEKKTVAWSEPYKLGGDYVQKNLATGEIRTAVNMPAGKVESKTGIDTSDIGVPTSKKIKDYLLENKQANPDIPYYDLWGQLAEDLKKQGLNPDNYDQEFWEILHPEGKAGYEEYVKQAESETSDADLQKAIEELNTSWWLKIFK